MYKLIYPLIFFIVLLLLISCSEYDYPRIDPVQFCPVKYQGQLDDEAAELFASDGVYRIEVDIAEALFDTDNSNGVDYTYLADDETSPATFKFYHDETGEGDPIIINGIGMRMRGGWSFNNAPKKKYKIIFPDDRNRFYGLKRINLNSNFGDPSFMREKLAYDFFNYAGVPSGRTTYTRLYFYNPDDPLAVDGYVYKGLYLIVEQVKATYFRARFNGPIGNCYKNNSSELTARVPADPLDYVSSPTNPQPSLEIMTNKDEFDPSDIIEFADILNNTPDELFEERISEYVCVYELLSALAINSLTGMIDDYWYYAHNFFLYNYNGRFMWIPWDLDSSFGVMWAGFVVETSDIYAFRPRNTDWTTGERPLIDRFMVVPDFVDYYRKCHKYYIENYFNLDHLEPEIEAIKALIMDAALEDPYQVFTEQELTDALEDNSGEPHGIKPYIRDRGAYVMIEVDGAY